MPQIYFKMVGLITIVMLGVCFAALIVAIGGKNKVGCQSPNCKCEDKNG